MKKLVDDVLAIFSHQSVEPVLIRAGLSHREKAALQPSSVISVDWATSMDELNAAFALKTQESGAVGYHITEVEKHKPGNDEQYLLAAKATLYTIDEKTAYH